MHITLIGTYHAERGAVTPSALLEILERIRPEVVFVEMPRTHLDAFRTGSHGNVESRAVARYAESHTIEVVPVDLPKPESSFFDDWEEVTRAIERTSYKFRHLMDTNTERTHQEGFLYINSDEYLQAWANICREESETIDHTGSVRLREMYVRTHEVIERRDLAMLQSIRTYCAQSALTRGVFLVGTAHRKSLIEKIQAAGEAEIPGVKWDISGSLARPG